MADTSRLARLERRRVVDRAGVDRDAAARVAIAAVRWRRRGAAIARRHCCFIFAFVAASVCSTSGDDFGAASVAFGEGTGDASLATTGTGVGAGGFLQARASVGVSEFAKHDWYCCSGVMEAILYCFSASVIGAGVASVSLSPSNETQ